MSNGIIMDDDTFISLTTKKQLLVLFQHAKKGSNYKFHQKIQYYWLIGLTGIGAFLGALIFSLKGGI